MKIQGNTTGSYAPRADYAVTDPKNPAFIKNKPNEAIKSAQDAATAAKTAADAAITAAQKAQSVADNALPKSGGEMTGPVKLRGIHLTPGVDYGKEFPEGAEEGRLFWLEVVTEEENPEEGSQNG